MVVLYLPGSGGFPLSPPTFGISTDATRLLSDSGLRVPQYSAKSNAIPGP